MKFSVIIPVFNSEAFLKKCIGSIVEQEYRDYELILIDDGSTDRSRQICEEYAAQYENIRVICQENSGPSAARNRGIDCARGDYVTFVDSDDWVKPGYFRGLADAVAEKPDLVFFGTGHFDGQTEVAKVFPEANVTGNEQVTAFITEHYSAGDICGVVNKAFSTAMLRAQAVRFPVGTVVEEDLQFVLLAADKAQSLRSVQGVLYCYNRRAFGSITTKYNPQKFDSKTRAYREELRIAEKWNSGRLAAIFHDNYLSYISSCINNLMYEACPLSKREKLDEIRRFYGAEETQSCIRQSKGLCLRSKVMYGLVRLRLYRVSFLLHRAIFCLRRR